MTKTNDTTLRAFHDDPKIKAKYLRRVQAHAAADEILQGYGYWRDGKGCGVGCTIHSGAHRNYETELGIPMWLAYLEDGIFEGLPPERAKTWPAEFLEAIQPGADLCLVALRFMVWLLGGVMSHADQRGKIAIQTVIDLYDRVLVGEQIERTAWMEAEATAWEAEAAAWAAAWAGQAAAYMNQADKLLELLRNAPGRSGA